MVTLETDRLTLRMLRESDFDAYAEMCGDAEVMRYIGDGQPMVRPMAWRNLAQMVGHWSLRGYGLWAVEERSSGVLVGRIGFWNPEGWPGFELGWMLRRSFWGRGYATEAARAALRGAGAGQNTLASIGDFVLFVAAFGLGVFCAVTGIRERRRQPARKDDAA